MSMTYKYNEIIMRKLKFSEILTIQCWNAKKKKKIIRV